MTKVLLKIINHCSDCPYYQYDSFYSMTQDSGWDCMHPKTWNQRIVDDSKKYTGIPLWCPLPDYNYVIQKENINDQ